jgi:glutamate-1-semialdehyde 2,1-aminomutase
MRCFLISFDNSKKLFKDALKLIPGGVNSPVRAFKSVELDPVFIRKGRGCRLTDEDGNNFIDYIMSWGPLICGHSPKFVYKKVKKSIKKGSSYGLPTKAEIEIASLISECMPSIEKVRLCSSGTEAAMAGIRVARAYSKKNKIIKFEGCYHGHSDSLLVKAGSGALTHKAIDSNGITKGVSDDTITLAFNDIESVHEAFLKYKDHVACIIVEPVAANMGVVLPEDDFLKKLRIAADENNSVLIFDEVITGFRAGIGGAQGLYNVKPDITILGKIIGGGYPIGAFGGRKEIMDMISPEGDVYHAGTLSGNPVAVNAGIALIRHLMKHPEIYPELEEKTNYLTDEIEKLLNEYKVIARIQKCGSLFTLFFNIHKVVNLKTALSSNLKLYSCFFKSMLNNNVIIPPSQFEALFISTAHKKKDLDITIKAVRKAFQELCSQQ